MRTPIFLIALLIATSACGKTENEKPAVVDGPSRFAGQASDHPKLTVANWQNEKVAVLGNPKTGYLSKAKLIGGDSALRDRPTYIYLENKPEDGLPNDTYAGKIGTVVSDNNKQTSDGFTPGTYTIVLDGSGEKIVTNNTAYLCPFSLLQKIKSALEGKTVWAKGTLNLYTPGDPPADIFTVGHTTVSVHPTESLVISAVEPGHMNAQICIRGKTADGREGCIYVGTGAGGGIGFWAMLSPTQECGPSRTEWEPDRFFHLEDPVARHPDWTTETWDQIKNGQVAVGMTDEMVSAACGPAFYFQQLTVSSTGGVSTKDWIHTCCANQRSFAIENGKVTKYMH
jgi:hypothetical protein